MEEEQVYRINPSTLTLASGTTYKARVWFRNSSTSDNKYKEKRQELLYKYQFLNIINIYMSFKL